MKRERKTFVGLAVVRVRFRACVCVRARGRSTVRVPRGLVEIMKSARLGKEIFFGVD